MFNEHKTTPGDDQTERTLTSAEGALEKPELPVASIGEERRRLQQERKQLIREIKITQKKLFELSGRSIDGDTSVTVEALTRELKVVEQMLDRQAEIERILSAAAGKPEVRPTHYSA